MKSEEGNPAMRDEIRGKGIDQYKHWVWFMKKRTESCDTDASYSLLPPCYDFAIYEGAAADYLHIGYYNELYCTTSCDAEARIQESEYVMQTIKKCSMNLVAMI